MCPNSQNALLVVSEAHPCCGTFAYQIKFTMTCDGGQDLSSLKSSVTFLPIIVDVTHFSCSTASVLFSCFYTYYFKISMSLFDKNCHQMLLGCLPAKPSCLNRTTSQYPDNTEQQHRFSSISCASKSNGTDIKCRTCSENH